MELQKIKFLSKSFENLTTKETVALLAFIKMNDQKQIKLLMTLKNQIL